MPFKDWIGRRDVVLGNKPTAFVTNKSIYEQEGWALPENHHNRWKQHSRSGHRSPKIR
jgi:hypothetical protein